MTSLYILSDVDGRVRYVGKTIKPLAERRYRHIYEARKGQQNHRCNWIRSVDSKIQIDLVEEVQGDGAAEEIALIAGLRAMGVKLVNGTDGGQGTVGRPMKPETKAKVIAANKAKRLSPEHRQAISASLKFKMNQPGASARWQKMQEAVVRTTPEQLEEMRELAAEQLSHRQIAIIVGCSPANVSMKLRGVNYWTRRKAS